MKVVHGVFSSQSAGACISIFCEEEASVGKHFESLCVRGYQLESGDRHCSAKFKLRTRFSHQPEKNRENGPLNNFTPMAKTTTEPRQARINDSGTNFSWSYGKLHGCEQC